MEYTSDCIRLLVALWVCVISDSSNAKRDSSSVMACCFLSQIFQDGQCLRSFCAPSLGMLQEVLSSFDNSLPKQGNMSQIQSWITSPIQSDSCICIQISFRNDPAVRLILWRPVQSAVQLAELQLLRCFFISVSVYFLFHEMF